MKQVRKAEMAHKINTKQMDFYLFKTVIWVNRMQEVEDVHLVVFSI